MNSNRKQTPHEIQEIDLHEVSSGSETNPNDNQVADQKSDNAPSLDPDNLGFFDAYSDNQEAFEPENEEMSEIDREYKEMSEIDREYHDLKAGNNREPQEVHREHQSVNSDTQFLGGGNLGAGDLAARDLGTRDLGTRNIRTNSGGIKAPKIKGKGWSTEWKNINIKQIVVKLSKNKLFIILSGTVVIVCSVGLIANSYLDLSITDDGDKNTVITTTTDASISEPSAESKIISALTDKAKQLEDDIAQHKSTIADLKEINKKQKKDIKWVKFELRRVQAKNKALKVKTDIASKVPSNLSVGDLFAGWSFVGISADVVMFSFPNKPLKKLYKGDYFMGIKILSIEPNKGRIKTSRGTIIL